MGKIFTGFRARYFVSGYYGYNWTLCEGAETQIHNRLKDTYLTHWNCGHIPFLLAHPASAGHRLNLQTGGHTIVWFGLTWSLEAYQQLNAPLAVIPLSAEAGDMGVLYLDLETFNRAPIAVGPCRYAETVEVLLAAYASGNDPVKI